jgi:hypothetical protein
MPRRGEPQRRARIPAPSTTRIPPPTASRINPLGFPCRRSRTATLASPRVGPCWGRRRVTRRATRVPGDGPPTLLDRSGGLAATVRAHLVQVRWLARYERATRVSRGRAELDAAQGMHGPGDTGPSAVMGVVVACAAQVPRSAPVADHPAHDDRLRVAGLPSGSFTRRLPPNERATPAGQPLSRGP